MALYLTYRPQTFSDLTGQKFIKETLSAAISQDKTVGAYLFTGPRGTGKTSTARIFAKAINCLSNKNGDPCNSCDICKSFNDDKLIDIIEIDAASHTGVDNIRDIIEKAQFSPTQCKYKIYIVDEVHMLSKGAFNALLKILEEPPKHVKFILATTEIHKVPETILSRCQRYDFKNFSPEDIISRLKYIAESESISVDDESYTYIVKNAGGGMRNAVSLFEQLIHEGKISYDYIVSSLGISGEDEKHDFIEKLLSQNTQALSDFERFLSEGKNLKILFTDILYLLRDSTREKLEKGENIRKELYILDALQEMLMKSKNSFDEALTLQIGLLKILSPDSSQESEYAAESKTQRVTRQKKENTKEVLPKTPELSYEHVTDIFSEPEIHTEVSVTQNSLDIEKIISEAKALGAKAALTMSLKGSNISKDEDDILSVKTKTKIAQSTISKTENRDILMGALEKLEITFSDIHIS